MAVNAPNVAEGPTKVAVDPGSDAEKVHQAVSAWGRQVALAIRTLQNAVATATPATAPAAAAAAATSSPGAPVAPGAPGANGWTPVIALVTYLDTVVMQIADWTGGGGTKPPTGLYVGASGFVASPAAAINVRGPAGSSADSYSTIINVVNSGADYTGVADATAAFAAAIAQAMPDGPIWDLILRAPIGGFTMPNTSVVTISHASPAVVTWAAHGLAIGDPVIFTTTGTLPSPLQPGTTYYVIAAGFAAGAFEISTVPGGAAINTTSAGSGTHSAGCPTRQWAARPAIAAVGGLGSGFAAVGNFNGGGYLTGFKVTNQGADYAVIAKLIDRVATSDVITATSGTFDARLVAGVSVHHESLPHGTTIINRISSTQLQLSVAMTFTNTDTFVFGLPWITVGGTPYYDEIIPILGTPKKLYCPPGAYLLPAGFGVVAGMSNVWIEARGVDFIITNTPSQGAWFRFCNGLQFHGGRFKFLGSQFALPSARLRYPGQAGIAIACCNDVYFYDTQTWDAFDYSWSIAGVGAANYPLCTRVYLVGIAAINGCGDGIHFTYGSKEGRVSRASILFPNDDALAVVNDGAAAVGPDDIVFEDCQVVGGLYRGCVAVGATRVTFRNIAGRDTHGPFCWAANDSGFGAPSEVAFLNVIGRNLGNTAVSTSDSNSGVGIFAASMTGLKIRDCVFTQDASVLGTNNLFSISSITTLDWDAGYLESFGTAATLAGALNTDVDCQLANGFASVTLPAGRWIVHGTITARSSTGAALVIWPVFYDGTTEYGRGADWQYGADLTFRNQLTCQAPIEVAEGATKTIRFRVKQGGGGVTLDCGTPTGKNSYIVAHRLT